MPARRPPRLHPSFYTGAARIFFTMCTFARHRNFADAAIVRAVHLELLHQATADDVEILDVVSYIVANPVRAGICTTPAEYPHTGSSRWRFEDLVASLG